MKQHLYIWLLVSLLVTPLQGQTSVDSRTQDFDRSTAPSESVYIHLNNSLFLSGEYLFFSIYCFDQHTKNLSQLSKVAYVELIGPNGYQVFKQKVLLETGRGYSDFFIDVDIPSGNYKLIGYTNWMKNKELESFFMTDLTIINPYKIDLTNANDQSTDSPNIIPDNSSISEELDQSYGNDLMILSTDKSKYQQR